MVSPRFTELVSDRDKFERWSQCPALTPFSLPWGEEVVRAPALRARAPDRVATPSQARALAQVPRAPVQRDTARGSVQLVSKL